MAGGVGDRFFGVGVGFEEDAVGAGREGGAGEGRYEFALAATDAAGCAGKLHTVGGVDDCGVPVAGHDAEAAHIDDEVLVAEGRAPVGLPDFFRAGFFELIGHKLHFVRGEELAFLDVDRTVGRGGRDEQVSLAAEEGGDLEGVDNGTDCGALVGRVDISDRLESIFGFDSVEDFHAAFEAGAAIAADRGAVGLIEGALEKDI